MQVDISHGEDVIANCIYFLCFYYSLFRNKSVLHCILTKPFVCHAHHQKSVSFSSSPNPTMESNKKHELQEKEYPEDRQKHKNLRRRGERLSEMNLKCHLIQQLIYLVQQQKEPKKESWRIQRKICQEEKGWSRHRWRQERSCKARRKEKSHREGKF